MKKEALKWAALLLLLGISTIGLQCQTITVPFRAASSKANPLPLWIENPLYLQYKTDNNLDAAFFVSPFKFWVEDLHIGGAAVRSSIPLRSAIAASIKYIRSPVFSLSSFSFSVESSILEPIVTALSVSPRIISIPTFGSKFSLAFDFFAEYHTSDLLHLAFVYRPGGGVASEGDIATVAASLSPRDEFSLGFSANVFMHKFTSYGFFADFYPTKELVFGIDVSTKPMKMTFSVGYCFSDFVLSLFVEYHSALMFSQTLCITIAL